MLGWVLFVIALILLVCVVTVQHRELKRIAFILNERDPDSNARLTMDLPGDAYESLVLAINNELDAAEARKLAFELEQKAFQAELANLSHDIRTPLAGAKGYMQLAEGECDKQAAQLYREKATQRLDAVEVLLDQLFAYSKSADADLALSWQMIDPVVLLTEVLAERYEDINAKGWELELRIEGELFVVEGDPQALRRVFENLIQNALLYGTAAPAVSISHGKITMVNAMSEDVVVDDTRLFDRFYRGDVARSIPGTGLGLSVVKNFRDAMGIHVEAHVEEASFQVVLDFAHVAVTSEL